MIKGITKRVAAGMLSALTMVSGIPLSQALYTGPIARAAEDDVASAIVIEVGDTYNVADRGVRKAWFQQNGAPRNVWPMFTTASDGTEIRAYCADHSKTNPGTGGMTYTVTGRVSDMHVYTVTYTGSKIPVLPGLNPDITVSQLAIAIGLLLLLILLLIWRYIRWHIARVYVYNEERRIHDVVSRQYVRVRTPKIRLAALQGHEETEYTVILRRRLAKRLVGRDIAIETGGEGQHHVVESFVGSDYAFQVQIWQKPLSERLSLTKNNRLWYNQSNGFFVQGVVIRNGG